MRSFLLLLTALLLAGCKPQPHKDPRVDAAVAAARASLTNFISALQAPKTNQVFFRVLAWVPSGPPGHREGVWANVWKYERGSFLGSVSEGNEHIGLTNNQPVRIPASSVLDWAYMDLNQGVVGDFLTHALQGETGPQNRASGKPLLRSGTNPTPSTARSGRSP